MVSTPVGSNCFFPERFQTDPCLCFGGHARDRAFSLFRSSCPGMKACSVPTGVSSTALSTLLWVFYLLRLQADSPASPPRLRREIHKAWNNVAPGNRPQAPILSRHASKYDHSQEMGKMRWTDCNFAAVGTVSDPETPASMLRSYRFQEELRTWQSTWRTKSTKESMGLSAP